MAWEILCLKILKATEKKQFKLILLFTYYMKSLPKTLGALKSSGYTSKSVKEEMRSNLIQALQSGTNPFPGIQGYEDTVIPQLQTFRRTAKHHRRSQKPQCGSNPGLPCS
jgi:DNA-binding NarL/FixJ family response regulator